MSSWAYCDQNEIKIGTEEGLFLFRIKRHEFETIDESFVLWVYFMLLFSSVKKKIKCKTLADYGILIVFMQR